MEIRRNEEDIRGMKCLSVLEIFLPNFPLSEMSVCSVFNSLKLFHAKERFNVNKSFRLEKVFKIEIWIKLIQVIPA